MLRVDADFLGVFDLHSDVNVGVLSIADLNDGQTRREVRIYRSNGEDFGLNRVSDVFRRHLTIQKLRYVTRQIRVLAGLSSLMRVGRRRCGDESTSRDRDGWPTGEILEQGLLSFGQGGLTQALGILD